MAVNEARVKSIGQRLLAAQNILLVSHKRPDGDAIGSLLGLGLALQSTGKTVQMVSVDGVPASFRHLEGSAQIIKSPQCTYDLVCVLDCSDFERIGGVLDGYGRPDVNIDHHQTNLSFAEINLVDTKAVATAEIIADILPELGLSLPLPAAAALLTGLITDSLGFRTANMTPKALRLAADLTELGLDLPDLYRRALVTRSYEATRLWGAGLSRLQRDGRLVWTALTLADREAVNYPGRDDADLVNVLVSIEDADIALIFLEQPGNRVKVSWRSRPGLDVSAVAVSFGGGGHPNASGAEIQGDLEEVQKVVLMATSPVLEAQQPSTLEPSMGK